MSVHPDPAAVQEVPFAELTGIEIRATRLDLVVEADSDLTSTARLLVDPDSGAPELTMQGSRLILRQEGRYRGSSAPVLQLPAGDLPTVVANISRGNLTLENIVASIAINISSGNLSISGGEGDSAINISSGDVAIRHREGDIACQVSSGAVSISRCHGAAGISTSKGDISIHDCSGDLSLKLGRGDVAVVRPIDQHVNISGSKSDIRIQGGSLASADVNISRGDIKSTARLVLVESRPGSDEDDLSDFQEAIDDAVGATEDEVQFNLGSVQFTAGESGLRLSTGGTERLVAGPEGLVVRGSDGEPIFVANERGVSAGMPARKGDEQFRFRTSRGSITLDVSADQPARVELIVNRGDVQSDIRLVEVGRPGPRSSTRRFVGVSDSSETDRILVRARTDRGDIQIRSVEAPREPSHAAAAGMSTRNRQRRQILESLAAGKLTAAEADVLLKAMEREAG